MSGWYAAAGAARRPDCATLRAMADLVLCTLNARWTHASLGLRCLLANLGPTAARTALFEATIDMRPHDVVERLLAHAPRVVGFGVYVWNVEPTTRVVALLRQVAPEVRIVLGGPEVSHELDAQPIVALADHVVTGAADLAFAELARRLLAGESAPRVIEGGAPDPATLALPYAHYDATDIAHRTLYVEASRGCPFKCEFCLSALDRTAEPFALAPFLDALADLHARGARRFKFVDRTFNLRTDVAGAILDFLLQRQSPDDPVFAHFELVPDRLPAALHARLAAFPPGTLQLEIGIQTWDPQVQARISRRQDNERAQANLRWLREHTHAHLHVDLIVGLPGETLAGFGAGFDRLVALRPHEIQVGVLKRLRGAPIARHEAAFELRFDPHPPYALLSSSTLSFADVQRLSRLARYWDLVGNAGRFADQLPALLGDAPFARLLAFSDWLWARSDATHRFTPQRLQQAIDAWLASSPAVAPSVVPAQTSVAAPALGATPQRQRRHLAVRVLAATPAASDGPPPSAP